LSACIAALGDDVNGLDILPGEPVHRLTHEIFTESFTLNIALNAYQTDLTSRRIVEVAGNVSDRGAFVFCNEHILRRAMAAFVDPNLEQFIALCDRETAVVVKTGISMARPGYFAKRWNVLIDETSYL
jgi:hypothetical protein